MNLLAVKVRSEILKEVQQAKCYSIIFDSTTDILHKDQLTEIIMYVKFHKNRYVIEERLIDF